MIRPTSPRDLELLSTHLDGQLTPGEAEALLARLEREPALTAAFKQLQRTRTALRRAPQRRVPRSFTLTAKMAGERVRSGLGTWSGFNFASALAALALILVLVTDFSYNGLPVLGAPTAQEPMLMMAEAPVEENYSADLANAAGAAESQPVEEAQGGAESDMLRNMAADEAPSMKEAGAPTLTQWIAMNARTLETLLASLAIIAGLLAWHHRRR